AKITTYTEVTFDVKGNENLGRPDGLIVIEIGKRQWTALVEAKVGKSEISAEQLERYLQIAKAQKIDAVITISNQFSTIPQHHPVKLNTSKFKNIELFHFSWMHIMTIADLLTVNRNVDDDDQAHILKEFLRFISHSSAGVEGFNQMPKAWANVANLVQAGATLSRNEEVLELAEAWQQESKDLRLILSRQLGTFIHEKMKRTAWSDAKVKFEDDVKTLIERQALSVVLDIPDAVSPLSVLVDFKRRTVLNSMYLKAPTDKVSNRARLNWLLRQIPEEVDPEIHLRMYWPGTSVDTQLPLSDLRSDPDRIGEEKGKMTVIGFDVIMPIDLGNRFSQTRTIIQELEAAVPKFYQTVGQHLKEWQPPAPKLSQERVKPETVTPENISESIDDSKHIN
ncbi:unnamed protein product, partial [Ectocarpus sp. 12 AP-2014]